MPKVGDKDFPYTDEGIKQAAAESEVSGMPISNAADRNVTTYEGGGKTGFNVPQPTMDDVGLMEYEKGGKVTEGARKHLEDALKHLEDAEKPKNIDTLIEAMKRRGKYNPPKRKPRIVPPRKKS